MANAIAPTNTNNLVVPAEPDQSNLTPLQYHPTNINQLGKFVDEFIAIVKDDHINTKRAILSNTASTAKVQNQNERVIAACERELQREDLPQESRDTILRNMCATAESTARESAASQEFQREQLNHSHALLFKFIGMGVSIALVIVGSKRLIRTKA